MLDPSMQRGPDVSKALPRYALVYTTSGWDAFIESMYRRNAARAASGDVYVVVDESRGKVVVPRACAKTSATPEAAAALGLRLADGSARVSDNIDYLYYIFFHHNPSYEYYVFLDYDAYANTDVDQLVAEVARRRIDHVGAEVAGSLADGVQTSGSDGPDALDASLSAVTVLSRAALTYLFMRRRQMATGPTLGHQARRPIHETFVLTELKRAGFVSAPLREFGDVASFAFWPPTLDEKLGAATKPGFVHPVLDRPRFFRAMIRHSKTRDFVRPSAHLWQAIRSCRDWRWAVPLASEVAHRLSQFARGSQTAGRSRPLALGPVPARRVLRVSHAGRVITTCNRNGRYGIGKATGG